MICLPTIVYNCSKMRRAHTFELWEWCGFRSFYYLDQVITHDNFSLTVI